MSNLTISLLQINPVAFDLFGWPVRWYGLIIGLGIVLAYLTISFQAKQKRMDMDKVSDLFFWSIILGFVGARIYYILFNLPYYLTHPDKILAIWEGGIAIYGGIIAGISTIYYLSRRYRVSLWDFLDISVFGILIAQILGRWGNFVNQEAHGGAVDRAFLVKLHLPNWLIEQMNIGGTYYHPTFLYESLWNLIGLLGLFGYKNMSKGIKKGDLTLLYLGWYGMGRFMIEGMRSDSLYFGPIRISQFVAMCFVILASIGLYFSHKYDHLPFDQNEYKE